MKLEIRNLTKSFEKNEKALNNLSINIKEKQITGLIGFNGSGKTTTFNIICNYIENYEGSILVNGKKIDKFDRNKISYLGSGADRKNPKKVMTYLKDVAFLYDRSLKETKKLIMNLAKELKFTQFLNKPFRTLSKGNQQKIKVIISFLNPNAKIYLLDEPFDGLDPLMIERIKKMYMNLKNATIIITSHRMEIVQSMCKEFYILKEGVLIDEKTTSDKSILIEINKEMPIAEIKEINYVQNVIEKEKSILITIDGISNFVDFNKKVIKHKNFKWISLKEKSISESLFEGYGT